LLKSGLATFSSSNCTLCRVSTPCSVYDAAKRVIAGSEDADDETFSVQLLAGGMAGGAAAGKIGVKGGGLKRT